MSSDMYQCNEYRRTHGQAYPRTCVECGVGKCKYGLEPPVPPHLSLPSPDAAKPGDKYISSWGTWEYTADNGWRRVWISSKPEPDLTPPPVPGPLDPLAFQRLYVDRSRQKLSPSNITCLLLMHQEAKLDPSGPCGPGDVTALERVGLAERAWSNHLWVYAKLTDLGELLAQRIMDAVNNA